MKKSINCIFIAILSMSFVMGIPVVSESGGRATGKIALWVIKQTYKGALWLTATVLETAINKKVSEVLEGGGEKEEEEKEKVIYNMSTMEIHLKGARNLC